ncbi:MAG: UvrB/UvrC motif-containing protein [Planctomycetota bacterium]|jgi:excinuclease ABC subunit C
MTARRAKDRIGEIREKIKSFPTGPGLYFMKAGGDTVLYIGKAKNLRSRVSNYFQPGSDLLASRGPKILEMINKVQTVDYLETKSEVDAVLQEARLIKDIHPPYNTHLVDSKTFPYLEITTREDFPGVYITRNPKSTRSKLFGPFTGVKDLRAVLVVLQKIFKFRTCNLDIREDDQKRRFFRPCLLYSIKQCMAPCGARIEKSEYKQIIKDMIKFLQSKRSTVLRKLKKQMAEASANTNYEAAAMYRDRIRLIERLDDRGTVEGNVQPEIFAPDPSEALGRLQEIFGSAEPIRIIEGFDIAHIAGAETVGALVKFIDGRPFKSGYRRFKIKTVKGIDDYACMAEVVTRRYKHARVGEELWPDLILIDGGLGHLHTVAHALKEMDAPLPALAAIAKAKEEIFIHGSNKPLRLTSTSPAKKLLQYVRDEAHRFAQHYHHILRTQKVLNKTKR